MKRSAVLLFFVVACLTGFSSDETGDDKRMEAFLNKVEKFYKRKSMYPQTGICPTETLNPAIIICQRET